MSRKGVVITAILCMMLGAAAVGEVVDASTGGFTVKSTIMIQATPAEVYKRLIVPADWWSSDHTFSHDSHNLTLEPHARGCWCEKLKDGGSVRHMEVMYVSPGKALVLAGELGPMLAMPVTGKMQIELTATPSGTKAQVTYAIGGYAPKGLSGLAPAVDDVITKQFTRLKNLIEQGDPEGKQAK